jgi:alcohol dehydrogenase class IV
MAGRDDWAFANPVKIRFGEGCLDSLGGLLDGRPYALVTYGEAPFVTLRRRIEADAGPPRLVVDDIEPNPSFAYLDTACQRFAAEGTQGAAIVALGGGSVIDAAKVFAAAGGDFARVRAYLEGRAHPTDLAAAPIIAVPTTRCASIRSTRRSSSRPGPWSILGSPMGCPGGSPSQPRSMPSPTRSSPYGTATPTRSRASSR